MSPNIIRRIDIRFVAACSLRHYSKIWAGLNVLCKDSNLFVPVALGCKHNKLVLVHGKFFLDSLMFAAYFIGLKYRACLFEIREKVSYLSLQNSSSSKPFDDDYRVIKERSKFIHVQATARFAFCFYSNHGCKWGTADTKHSNTIVILSITLSRVSLPGPICLVWCQPAAVIWPVEC
jgi:hypothetical protein